MDAQELVALKEMKVGDTVLLEGKTREQVRGALRYWSMKLHSRWKTRTTTKGLRIWRRS